MERLGDASREELCALVARLRAEIAALTVRVQQLEEENRRLRQGGGGTPLAVKARRPARERTARTHRRQAFVRRREQPDEIRHHAAECCPDCGRRLAGGWPHRSRQTIELIVQKRVVEHVLWGRWCGVCRRRVLPLVTASEWQVQGRRRVGVSVQSLVATLHIACRIPIRMIRRMLAELFGVHISDGEIVALLDGVRQAGTQPLQRLLEQVRGSPAVCGDETGWRQDGENGYLWGFFTPRVRYFVYRRSRAGQIPVEVLGEEFAGIVTCDFYAGYNRLGQRQRCWVHLLRDARELVTLNADRPEVAAWVAALSALYREAKAFSSPKPHARRHARRDFERQAKELAKPYANDVAAPQRLVAQRLLKHLQELFVFVTDPEVAADNNLAERSLRPAVIARKISGGTRSAKGSETKMGLMSLFGTWAAQGKPLLSSCQQLLLDNA